MSRILMVAVSLLLIAEPAWAYIGPGVGAGMIATVLGILTATPPEAGLKEAKQAGCEGIDVGH